MSIILDNREHKLIALLKDAQVKQLNVGDIHIISQDDESRLLAIIERKTLADMAASRKDGRWDEQKKRILQERENTNAHVVYIIEGGLSFDDEGFIHGLPSKTLVTMIFNCFYRYQIPVFFTRNLNDTADFIKAYAKRVGDFSVTQHVSIDYQEALIKSQRKSNVTQSTVFLSQLCAIPGISYKKAEAIASHHQLRCIRDLIILLSDKDEKQQIKVLEQVAGIGSKLAKEIINKIMCG